MKANETDVSRYDFLSPEQKKAMDQDGCFVVENALPPEMVAELEEAIDEVYARQKELGGLDGDGRLNLRNCVTHHDAFLQLIDWPKTFPKAMGILNWNIHLITSHLLVLPSKAKPAPDRVNRVGLHRDGGRSFHELPEPHHRMLFKIGYIISDQTDPASGATALVPGSNRYLGSPAEDRLDVSLLNARVIGPILGITDQRSDPRIDFIGGARGMISMNYKPGTAFFFEQRTYHGAGHNYSGKPRKTIFVGYAYRWVKPMDYIVMPEELLDRSNDVQKQLFGVVTEPLSFYLPPEQDVPLKKIVERA